MKIENRVITTTKENEYIKRKYTDIKLENLFKRVSLGINELEDNYTSIILTPEEISELEQKKVMDMEMELLIPFPRDKIVDFVVLCAGLCCSVVSNSMDYSPPGSSVHGVL